MNGIPLPSRIDDGEFAGLIAAAQARAWLPTEVAALAKHLAASGERFHWTADVVADIASTGGPGSLSTLLGPLALRVLGADVVKLGVPGRPAGAIDVMGTLPSFRTRSSTAEARHALKRCGYAHFIADDRFAPMDGALFRYRRQTDAVSVPSLVAASLLSKKLAVGVQFVGLDIRVSGHGNFGQTVPEARDNAALFCRAAASLGITATAFLSTGGQPAQPWVGRGESLAALAIIASLCDSPGASSWLEGHVDHCKFMASETLAPNTRITLSDREFTYLVRRSLKVHLEAHGSSLDEFRTRAAEVIGADRTTLESPDDGLLVVDLGAVRDALVSAQSDPSWDIFLDPAGVRFLARPGAAVRRGQPVAAVRAEPPCDATSVVEALRPALRVVQPGSEAAARISLKEDIVEVVRA